MTKRRFKAAQIGRGVIEQALQAVTTEGRSSSNSDDDDIGDVELLAIDKDDGDEDVFDDKCIESYFDIEHSIDWRVSNVGADEWEEEQEEEDFQDQDESEEGEDENVKDGTVEEVELLQVPPNEEYKTEGFLTLVKVDKYKPFKVIQGRQEGGVETGRGV